MALSHRFGLVPPVGAIVNPFSGAWKRSPAVFESGHGTFQAIGLQAPVRIVVDRDQVTHLFADNDHDLYFAQGYTIASERLWQMEFMVRTASGRLSEIMGRKTLDIDIYFTRLGLPRVAEASAAIMLQDPISGPAIRAYADGVNAYIDRLTPETLPFEYKLLGHRPRRWEAKNAAYLLKFMAWNLSASAGELPLSRSAHVLGRAGFNELFPLELKVPEPVIPPGTPQVEKSVAPAAPKEPFEPSVEALQPMPTPHPSNGSNNWAVTGKKSMTGLPILSNDIHLGLSLPALWYENQLSSPNQNVYGISLPGAPGVILGFNDSLAWGVTNGGDDVMDWFQLRYRDDKRSEYLYGGFWRPVISREVKIPIRGEEALTLVMRDAHFGPIVYDKAETPISTTVPKGLALRWEALAESNEIKNFLAMNRAKTVADCHDALLGFTTPALNFLCTDNKGQVGLWHYGKFPLRWKGQGRTIGDGSDPDYDWKGFLTPDEAPTVRNPARGFVSSANQPPFETNSPYYFGWPFEQPFRATRINELLRAKAKFTPEDFVKMQRDTLSVSMRTMIPVLKSALNGVALSDDENKALRALDKWDYRFEEDSRPAPLAYAWFKETEDGLWLRLFPERKTYSFPPLMRTIEILQNENSQWFDNPSTERKETRATIVYEAFQRALGDVRRQIGSSDPEKWTWAKFRPTEFNHAGKIPGLGHSRFAAAGMEHSIFANNGEHGPVWKMVVAVGPAPKAFGVYPGGQSGDPFSPHFEDFLGAWSRGEMKELQFLSNVDDADTRRLGVVTLKPGRAPEQTPTGSAVTK